MQYRREMRLELSRCEHRLWRRRTLLSFELTQVTNRILSSMRREEESQKSLTLLLHHETTDALREQRVLDNTVLTLLLLLPFLRIRNPFLYTRLKNTHFYQINPKGNSLACVFSRIILLLRKGQLHKTVHNHVLYTFLVMTWLVHLNTCGWVDVFFLLPFHLSMRLFKHGKNYSPTDLSWLLQPASSSCRFHVVGFFTWSRGAKKKKSVCIFRMSSSFESASCSVISSRRGKDRLEE